MSGIEADNKELGNELSLFKKEAIDQHEKGFHKAVRQAKLFVEDLDMDRFDPFKYVKDGVLVDEEEGTG